MKASRAEKKRIHIRKHVSLVMSQRTCKGSLLICKTQPKSLNRMQIGACRYD